jgi:hypothetical protein
MTITCFWMESTDTARVGLRRYAPSSGSGRPCPQPAGYHDWIVYLGEAPLPQVREEDGRIHYARPEYAYPGRDDPRWPVACPCGYAFGPDDQWQEWSEALYRRADTGELVTIRGAPDGAMWDAWWMPDWSHRGPDGRCLVVKCPGGHDWMVDSRASNCTMPDDDEHRCWVRHGEPPAITVGKDGPTCAAGAGSIQCGGYHGFLRAGVFDP